MLYFAICTQEMSYNIQTATSMDGMIISLNREKGTVQLFVVRPFS